MQGLKLMIITGAFSLTASTAFAAPTSALPEATKTPVVAEQVNETAGKAAIAPQQTVNSEIAVSEADHTQAVQDQLASIVEEDYAFEKQRRQLANEVELEKMRSELRKLRGEDKMRSAPVERVAASSAPAPAQSSVVMPRVLLAAEIGGSQRVAVTDGNALRYVRYGEIFSMGGSNFKLAKDGKSVIPAEGRVQ